MNDTDTMDMATLTTARSRWAYSWVAAWDIIGTTAGRRIMAIADRAARS